MRVNFNKLTNPSQVGKIMRDYQFRFKKRFGQNFLVDHNILEKIVESSKLHPDQYVIEIGTGLGTLTRELAARAKKVISFEIDRDLIAILKEIKIADNVDLVEADALKADWSQILKESGWRGEQISLVANLPYYLTSPLIMKALEAELEFDSIVVMVQKEVAERIKADPGTKDYGVLSLAVRYYADVEIVTDAPRKVFMPAPTVDSQVIKLVPHKTRPEVDHEQLFTVIRAAFNQRRKTLKNNLKGLCKQRGLSSEQLESIFIKLNLRPDVRGETLSLKTFISLTKNLINSTERS